MYGRARYKAFEQGMSPDKLGSDTVISVKRDGAAFHVVVGPDGYAKFISRRQGVNGNYPDKTDRIPHLANLQFPKKFAGAILNVELVHTGQFPDGPDSHRIVSGILNSLSPRAIETQKLIGPVRAVMLDVLKPELPTYETKLEYMKDIEKGINKPELLSTIETHPLSEFENLERKTRDEKSEGLILTSLKTPEHENVRLKLKHRISHNLKITRILQEHDTHGNPKQSMGAAEVTDSRGHAVASVGTGWSREEREDAWKNPSKYLGQLIAVESMGMAKDRLRAPVYGGFADGDLDDASQYSHFGNKAI